MLKMEKLFKRKNSVEISKEGIKRDLYRNKGIPKEETERILTKLKQKGILVKPNLNRFENIISL